MYLKLVVYLMTIFNVICIWKFVCLLWISNLSFMSILYFEFEICMCNL